MGERFDVFARVVVEVEVEIASTTLHSLGPYSLLLGLWPQIAATLSILSVPVLNVSVCAHLVGEIEISTCHVHPCHHRPPDHLPRRHPPDHLLLHHLHHPGNLDNTRKGIELPWRVVR